MKLNKKATSIVEAMIVLLIVMIAVTWAFDMFSKSIKVTDSTGYKLEAIAIAKEWIEAMTNIRDTNWKVLPWDYTNCWNTLNYNINCHNSNSTANDIPNNTSFIVWKDNVDYRWKLESKTSGTYGTWTYIWDFAVWYDIDWFHTQSWWLIDLANPLNPPFTREIKVVYLDDGDTGWVVNSNHQKMQITSLVQWRDQASDNVKEVELVTILSNWKNTKK
jgi:hypothetical protein